MSASGDPVVALSEIARNWAIVVGAGVGVAIAVWRAVAADRHSRASKEDVRLNAHGHFTDVFSRAVDQLGSERLEIRLGAFYTLKQIGQDFPDFAKPIMELLAAYVRERTAAGTAEDPPFDVKEILEYVRETFSKETEDGRSKT